MVAPIDNRGPNTLKRALRAILHSGVEVRLQVAFVTRAGTLEVLSGLLRAANHGSVRIMTGLYEGFTEPAALRLLADAARKTHGRLQVRISRDARLHRKLYLVGSRTRGTCIVGSSNLTTEGLTRPDELNLLVSTNLDDQPFRGLVRRFDEGWRRNTVPVTAALIERYQAACPKQRRQTVPRSVLRKILGATSNERPFATRRREGTSPSLWRQNIEGFAAKKTQHIVEDETSWKRYDWYSNPSSAISTGDLILMFDSSGKSKTVSLVRVRDTTTVSVPTQDGRDFVAYTGVARCRTRRLGARLWKDPANLGVIRLRRDAWKARRLSVKRLNDLKALLRRRRAG